MTMASRPTSTDKAARWAAILDHLAQHGRLEVADAAELLGVSEATIRRDFTELSERQLVTRKHGGIAQPGSYEVTGPLAALVLDQLWIDIAILGVNGITASEGATCRHEAEAAICSHMARRSSQVVVVATGDKVGARTFAAIRPANEIDVLVTDRTAPAPALERLRDAGLEILQV